MAKWPDSKALIGQFSSKKQHSVRSYVGWPCWNRIVENLLLLEIKAKEFFLILEHVLSPTTYHKGGSMQLWTFVKHTQDVCWAPEPQKGEKKTLLGVSVLCVWLCKVSLFCGFFVRLFSGADGCPPPWASLGRPRMPALWLWQLAEQPAEVETLYHTFLHLPHWRDLPAGHLLILSLSVLSLVFPGSLSPSTSTTASLQRLTVRRSPHKGRRLKNRRWADDTSTSHFSLPKGKKDWC